MPRRPTAPTGLSSRLGPEAVGALVSVLVLIAVVVVASLSPSTTSAGPSASPGISAAPSVSTASQPPSARATATPAPWAASATTLIDVEQRLMERRVAIATLVDPRPARADDIARALRTLNGQLTFALDVIDGLDGTGLDADLVDRLRTAHAAALEASLEGLGASLANVGAYVSAGKNVVTALESLEALAAEVAKASGLPPPAG